MRKHISKTLLIMVLTILLPALCIAAEMVKKDLGVKNPSFGSAGQAREMLSFIKDNPHQREYQITYKTEVDTVFLECDLATDTLTRVHKRKDGTGTAEKWQDDVLYRLQATTKGGSLMDTKKGKSPGTITDF